MILRKETLTPETVKQWFPELLSDKEQYQYFVEVSALRIPNRKTLLTLHCQAARERHEKMDSVDIVMRELFSPIPAIRSHLDKPMRQAQREIIYSEARNKLLNEARYHFKDENHPYIRTLVTM